MTTKTSKGSTQAVHVVAVNVKPGTPIARLTAPQAAAHVAALPQQATDSAFALKWLVEHKLATPTGKLPKRFGG